MSGFFPNRRLHFQSMFSDPNEGPQEPKQITEGVFLKSDLIIA